MDSAIKPSTAIFEVARVALCHLAYNEQLYSYSFIHNTSLIKR